MRTIQGYHRVVPGSVQSVGRCLARRGSRFAWRLQRHLVRPTRSRAGGKAGAPGTVWVTFHDCTTLVYRG